MNYDWKNYGEFALKLDDLDINKETITRNTISRLFYHAYHCLEIWAEKSLGYNFEQGERTHFCLYKHIKKNRHIDKANDYWNLKRLREICDYDDISLDDLDILLEKAKSYYKNIVEPLAQFSQKNDS